MRVIRLSASSRKELFDQGRALSPILGDLFQNPGEISALDVSYEASVARQQMMDKISEYNQYMAALSILERNLLQKGCTDA